MTFAEIVKGWETDKLLQFLINQSRLRPDQEDIALFKYQKIRDYSFLNIKEKQLTRCKFKFGPAWDIMSLISNLNNHAGNFV
ncbi:15033_t:CDS:2 [Dentiscutata erythropus]|uniref:15033_t:CDS:1 n=1 Tax=Dentiscutata erythropus TaxID=1348616 RepID=A0A9N8ZA28_9GLOM|nr:15033_t:CDS:2 [Dentiscutata erythropus]